MIQSRRMNRRNPRPLRRTHSMEVKGELKMKKELIDFDIIKGSAYFHTKPSNHNKEMVRRGFISVFLFPLYRNWWTKKFTTWPYFWGFGASIYLLHVISIMLHIFQSDPEKSKIRIYEVYSPAFLLFVTAIGYARVEGLLAPTEPLCDIDSVPTKEIPKQPPSDNGVLEPDGESSTSSTDTEGETEISTDSEPEKIQTFTAPDENCKRIRGKNVASLPTNPWHDKCSNDYFTCRTVNVCVWDDMNRVHKIGMCVTELRATILEKVKATPSPKLYRYVAVIGAALTAILPTIFRIFLSTPSTSTCTQCVPIYPLYDVSSKRTSHKCLVDMIDMMTPWKKKITLQNILALIHSVSPVNTMIATTSLISTGLMAFVLFSALADAEEIYQRRFLYAKCFTALTSSRRARRSRMPHFRLKNVVNIKAWISLRGGRSWLKRQGRQRAADEIVSSSFLVVLVLLVILGGQVVANQNGMSLFQNLLNLEVYTWCLTSSVFLLRFIMLGAKINKKYQNSSLLLTEQMNLYLRLLQAPHKRDRLLVSNNVLKLATKLLKELSSPNKVSGLTMNPLLYNITRVVLLSAFSAALSEFFGFKLKLWKMKV